MNDALHSGVNPDNTDNHEYTAVARIFLVDLLYRCPSNVFNKTEIIRSIGLFDFVPFHCKLDRAFNEKVTIKFTLEKKMSLVVTLLGISDIREKISLFSSTFQT